MLRLTRAANRKWVSSTQSGEQQQQQRWWLQPRSVQCRSPPPCSHPNVVNQFGTTHQFKAQGLGLAMIMEFCNGWLCAVQRVMRVADHAAQRARCAATFATTATSFSATRTAGDCCCRW